MPRQGQAPVATSAPNCHPKPRSTHPGSATKVLSGDAASPQRIQEPIPLTLPITPSASLLRVVAARLLSGRHPSATEGCPSHPARSRSALGYCEGVDEQPNVTPTAYLGLGSGNSHTSPISATVASASRPSLLFGKAGLCLRTKRQHPDSPVCSVARHDSTESEAPLRPAA
jgi:hypothetical protein